MEPDKINGEFPEEKDTQVTQGAEAAVEEETAELPQAQEATEEPEALEEEPIEEQTAAEEGEIAQQKPSLQQKLRAFFKKVSLTVPDETQPEAQTEEATEEATEEEATEEGTQEQEETAAPETEPEAEEAPAEAVTPRRKPADAFAIDFPVEEEAAAEEAEETQQAEPQEEMPEAGELAEAAEEAEPVKKKLKPTHLALAIAGTVVLVGALVFAVLLGLGFDFKPRENDVFYKDTYTAEEEQLIKEADTVVATLADKELTVGELQLYYINGIYTFYSQNYYYMEYLGLDLTAPLDKQTCLIDESMTWEQYFLDGALQTWQSYTLLELMAEQDQYKLSEEAQTQIDSMMEQVESIATAYGYADSAEYLREEMAPGVSAASYVNFNRVYYMINEYLTSVYEEAYPTDVQIRNYYELNKATFEENGIVPNMGQIADVRHILIQPQGGTVGEDGTQTEYSEEEWNTALSEAERILEAWKAGEATESSFAALANTYTMDPGSSTTGGLYEGIDPFASYAAEFRSWAVDNDRQVGDTGIVKTSFGYHIMYFVAGEDYFNAVVGEQLVAERIQTNLETLKESNPMEVNYKKIVLNEETFA